MLQPRVLIVKAMVLTESAGRERLGRHVFDVSASVCLVSMMTGQRYPRTGKAGMLMVRLDTDTRADGECMSCSVSYLY